MPVLNTWKFDRVWSAHILTSYSAVHQQLIRHRSFSFSIESSRAKELDLTFIPEWRGSGEGRMFSQTELSPNTIRAANLIWNISKYTNIFYSNLLKKLGIHRQHYNLITKPWAEVDIIMSGSQYAWDNFFNLRLSEKSGAQSDISILANELHKAFNDKEEIKTKTNYVYGPYIPSGVSILDLNDLLTLNKENESVVKVLQAITRVGRVSTGKLELNPDPESSHRFIKRAIDQKHASVFEHHWTPVRKDTRVGPYLGAKSVRNIFNL